MSASLPDRPNLDQLRRQAKELRAAARVGDPLAAERIARRLSPRPADSVTLAAAQLVIAREHGFTSWPKLKAAVDAAEAGSRRNLQAFLLASVENQTRLAARLLAADPSIGRADIFTAAVLGDADRIAELLARDPARASAVDEARGWPPLLHVCYTMWHRVDPGRIPGTVAAARLLLDAGASPGTNNGGRPNQSYRSALHGSVSTNKPGITRLLLERGADPNDRVSLNDAVGLTDHECLRLLVGHGATLAGTWALEEAVGTDAEAVRLLLDAAGRTESDRQVADRANHVLPDAAQHGSAAVVGTLLAYGADPNSATDEGSPLRRAVRAGHADVADVLVEQGAVDDVGVIDRFLGACARGGRSDAEQLLAEHPGLLGELSEADRAVIVEAAARPGTAPVSLMLDLGFPLQTRNDLGETALHSAAYAGRAETVRLLLDRGAETDARDARFDSTPLAFATVGSGENPEPDGDWATTVRILLDAGAARDGVWLTGEKAPSEQVAEILSGYGVVEDEDPAEDRPEESGEPASPGAGLLGDMAEHLRAAYDSADLELFASLLHPEVRWGGGPEGCTDRAQVLAWYGDQLDRGVRGQVIDAEVRGGAVVIGLALRRPADSARPAPADLLYQVLRVREGLVVGISGHPDLAGARAAT